MKILILTGSPRSKGTTSLLADEFAKGAKEAGHEVVRFDTGILNIRPCIGCHHCQNNGTNKCVSDVHPTLTNHQNLRLGHSPSA